LRCTPEAAFHHYKLDNDNHLVIKWQLAAGFVMKAKIIGGWTVFALMVAAAFCGESALAGDSNAVVSMTIASNAVIAPRTIFTQTWTLQNTGTTTWTATANGYTLNMISWDTMGAIELYTNSVAKRFDPTAIIGSGKSIPPGGTATFSMMFIAPEAAGTYTDTFQLNSASSVYFGPQIKVQIVVPHAGSTLQYDRSRAVSYANNYAGYICSDGYFWTNGSGFGNYGTNVGVPTSFLGDDCAHFVSCCIGSESHQRGAGLYIPSRVPPTYGEPSAPRIVNTVLIGGGYAKEVSSLSQMMPGDVIGWNWEGDTDIADLDHVTFYLGNGLLASHAESCLDCSATTFFQSGEPHWVWHLIHIFDAPTLNVSFSNKNMVMSWTTNWSNYQLQTATSLNSNATWTTVTAVPRKIGNTCYFTNSLNRLGNAAYYRLMMPGN
jgi:hypothetical protein